MKASFVYVSALVCIPTYYSIKLIFKGGLGYYFGSYESISEWRTTWDLFDGMKTPNFKGNFQTLGYHLGVCVDYRATEKIYWSVELVYRIVNIDSGSIELNTERGSAMDFFQWLESKTFLDLDYEVSLLNMSGFALNVGLKFQF